MLNHNVFFGSNILQHVAIYVLIVTIVIACLSVSRKHSRNYKQRKITRGVFLRNTTYEIFGLLLIMVLAAVAGRYLAQIATSQIANELAKLIAGILIGLLAGVGVGLLVKRTWGKLIKT